VDRGFSDAIEGYQEEMMIDMLTAERELECMYILFCCTRFRGRRMFCCVLVAGSQIRTQPRSALSMPRMSTQAWLTWRDNSGRDGRK
jgi:hypothetical protein